MPLLDNRVILAGVALEITLMALFDYSAWGNLLLDTAPCRWRACGRFCCRLRL